MFPILDLSIFLLCFRRGLKCYVERKNCKMGEGRCLQAMKIVHHYASGSFDWLFSGQQSINPLREAISILSGKYKRFVFVHPVL